MTLKVRVNEVERANFKNGIFSFEVNLGPLVLLFSSTKVKLLHLRKGDVIEITGKQIEKGDKSYVEVEQASILK